MQTWQTADPLKLQRIAAGIRKSVVSSLAEAGQAILEDLSGWPIFSRHFTFPF